ncbi:MAG: glucose-1-phosphate thymidylyltransferase, partial [Muribaculaceae bacterium]|nr:glucose-1-phosphate thymidylyltransferase [Muribaculaceae bacterium]
MILFDVPSVRDNLLPLSYTRPVADFLLGVTTLRRKWETFLPGAYSYHVSAPYLAEKYPVQYAPDGEPNIFVASNVVATRELAHAVDALEPGEALIAETEGGERVPVAVKGSSENLHALLAMPEPEGIMFAGKVTAVCRLYDIFLLNARQIEADFSVLTEGREGQSVPRSNTVIGSYDDIFIESGAIVEGVVLNASHGPIYVGRHVEIMEGSCLRGPIALCDHATVNMGTKIYPGTSLGPWCKVGGELNNVVMFGYSNKAHDGFLGNAVI